MSIESLPDQSDPTVNLDIPPVVIYDFRVMSWMIFNCYERQDIPEAHRVAYLRSCWVMVANRGPNATDYVPHTAVFVDDNGADLPYWRKTLYPEYKAGRKAKPDQFMSVAQIGLNYITDPSAPFHYFSQPAYEADDFAGAFVYIKRLCQRLPALDPRVETIASRRLWLYTVDSDWLQLVGEGVTWFNSGPWAPRVRGIEGTKAWALKRLKVNIQRPEEIVTTKMRQGDKSDNLPPGSPRYMIDLLHSHPEYHLRYYPKIWTQLWLTLSDQTVNQRLDHYDKAKTFLARYGYYFPV